MYGQIKSKKRPLLIEAIGLMLMIVAAAVVAVLMVNGSTFLQTNSLLPAISAFGSTGSLTADSLAGVMYVQNADSNSISVVDLETNTIVRNITVDRTPHNIKLPEDQLTLYNITTDRDSGTILMLHYKQRANEGDIYRSFYPRYCNL